MYNFPNVIGYDLEKAKQLIGEGVCIITESTLTPFEDKKAERRGKTPVVVRQTIENDMIKLTTSLFK